MAKGDIKCTGVSTTSVKVRKIYSEISKNLIVNKSAVKSSMLEWLHKLKASLQIEDKSEAAQKAIEQLERKKNKLTEAYLDEIISKEDYKAKYSALEDQIREQQKLLIPVEENEDIKDIEAVIENIDKEIDTYIASSQFEDSKVDYLIEHTKKITVIDKEHYVIDLDLLAGVILIGKDFLLYVHNTVQINHGRECFYAQGKNARPFRSVFDRQFCNKYRRDWESASQRNSEQAERSGNTTGSAQSEADYVGGL